jgi:CubicO group peptidase (beta-lactamase class C family)
VLVAAGDQVLLRAAAGLADRIHGRVNQPDTIFDIGSLTKQFTAAAILRLQEEKKLSVDDGLERFFDDVPRDKRAIHLQHLMTHTSGLPPDVPVGSATTERKALLEACWKARLASKPGEVYVYNNVGYELLAAVIEVASGESYESYVARELFLPAGLGSTGFLGGSGVDVGRTARGYEGRTAYGPAEKGWYSWGLRGAGGVLSTVDDLWKWSRALESDGVLSEASRSELSKARFANYGFGWIVREDAGLGKVIEHDGTTRGFESWLARYVDRSLIVVVLCNGRGMRDSMTRGLTEAALGKNATQAGVAMTPGALQAFAGDYSCANGGKVSVSVVGEGLQLEPDLPAVLLLEFRTADVKLEKTKALADRARKLADLMAAGDAEALTPVLSDEWPGWDRQMAGVWRQWVDERGELRELEVLGSRGDEATLVRLVHERRTVIWTLRWEKGVLHGWSLQGGLPEGVLFTPVSELEFAHRDLEGFGMPWKLLFRKEGSTVRGFSLSGSRSLLASRQP